MGDRLRRRRRLVVGFVTWTLGWMIACYVDWLAKGCRWFFPFISDFDLYEPQDTMFTVGVAISGALFCWLAVELASHQAPGLRRFEGPFGALARGLGWATLIPAMLAGGGAIMIGFLPWNVYHTEHGVVALMLFYMGTLWCVAVTVTTLLASGWTPDAKRILAIRGAAAGMTASALALWIHHATIAYAIFDDDFDMSLYLDRPQDMMAFCTDSVILGRHGDLAAMWEAIMVVAMLGTVATFLPLFRDSAKMPRDGVLSDDEDVIE